LTALVLAPAAIALVFLAPEWVFRLAVAILLMTGSWEFHRLANLRPPVSWMFFGIQAGLIALMHLNWAALSGYATAVLTAGGLAWGLMFLRLAGYREEQEADSRFEAASFISALAAITFCWFALSWLRNQAHGEFLILLLLIIIWAADIGAYFSGRLFGKTKLAPSISPKKTWEGVVGGLLLAAIAATLMSRYVPSVEASVVSLLALTVVTVLASICGDLFISVHKRTVKLKDAGKLFPGHGGVLDRFDSLLPGSVFFALGARFLGS
jgi:phosphatidate cytidylyltransferase